MTLQFSVSIIYRDGSARFFYSAYMRGHPEDGGAGAVTVVNGVGYEGFAYGDCVRGGSVRAVLCGG